MYFLLPFRNLQHLHLYMGSARPKYNHIDYILNIPVNLIYNC